MRVTRRLGLLLVILLLATALAACDGGDSPAPGGERATAEPEATWDPPGEFASVSAGV